MGYLSCLICSDTPHCWGGGNKFSISGQSLTSDQGFRVTRRPPNKHPQADPSPLSPARGTEAEAGPAHVSEMSPGSDQSHQHPKEPLPCLDLRNVPLSLHLVPKLLLFHSTFRNVPLSLHSVPKSLLFHSTLFHPSPRGVGGLRVASPSRPCQ